ncbi:hypothetical protein M758_5G041700 [Ceratodon purpureus]|nr:hypothetical protein M758_5G041700 [Ceratodon purpureus]
MGVVDEDLSHTDAAHQALLTVLMVNAARKTSKQNSLAASRSCILSEHDHLYLMHAFRCTAKERLPTVLHHVRQR